MNLAIDRLSVNYGPHAVVRGLSATLASGSVCGLVGPNGAGKSSLLKALAGLVASMGDVSVGGRRLDAMTPAQRARTLAYLAQSTEAAWPISVSELVALGRLPHADSLPADTTDHVAVALAKTVTTELAQRRTDELSGGELARVQLARALCVGAPILLADEPTAQLDPYHQLHIMDLLRREADDDKLVVTVLHDLTLAARYCDRLLLLNEGRLVADGAPEDVLSAEMLRRVYRIEPIIDRHQDQLLVIPWTRS